MGKHCAPVRYDDDWIVAHWEPLRNWLKLRDEYNRVHGTDIKYSTFKAHCNVKLGLNYHYSEEQLEWLKENYPKLGRIKAAKIFNEKFSENKSAWAIKNMCQRMGLRVTEERHSEIAIENSGRYHPVGAVRPMAHGEPYVKTEDGWVPVKEQVMGKQKGKILVFLDGNQNNVEKNNLMFITRAVSARMTKNEFWSENPEITKTGILCCELEGMVKGA